MCEWPRVTLTIRGRADYVLCTWTPYYTASQRVSYCLIVLIFSDIDCPFVLFIPLDSPHIYGATIACNALRGIKWSIKMTLVLGAFLVLEWTMRKRKNRAYRKVLPHLDIFALWPSIVLFCIIQIWTVKLDVLIHAYNERFNWEQTHIQIRFWCDLNAHTLNPSFFFLHNCLLLVINSFNNFYQGHLF